MTFIIKIPLTKKDIKRIEQKYTSLELPKEKTVVDTFHFEWNTPNDNLNYVRCWNCAYNMLARESIGIPVDIVDQSFRCYGYFCSWECAVRYLYDNYFVNNPQDYYNQYSLLCIAYQKINNCKNCVINKAPPKEVLKEFGGTIDYDEYRNKNRYRE